MIQATDFGKLHDRTQSRRFDGSLVGHILVERKMSARRYYAK